MPDQASCALPFVERTEHVLFAVRRIYFNCPHAASTKRGTSLKQERYTEAVIATVEASPPATTLRQLDWYSFLARPRLTEASRDTLRELSQSSIFVTGAAGSIGAALSLRLAALSPPKIVLLDFCEQSLFQLQARFLNDGFAHSTAFYLGNAGDQALIDEILSIHNPSYIFHAAAHKHLSLLERHALAAIENNALATCRLLQSLGNHRSSNSSRLILLSTDKAADPASMLGASKAIAERAVIAHGSIALRLANVLGSTGSVVQLFQHQVTQGIPLTVTHPAAERYFLTSEESVDLLMAAAVEAPRGSLLIPPLHSRHTILSLAKFLLNSTLSEQPQSIQFTALRPGEKLTETLVAREEQLSQDQVAGCRLLHQPLIHPDHLKRCLSHLRDAVKARDIPATLSLVQEIVPAYQLSPELLTLAHPAAGVRPS